MICKYCNYEWVSRKKYPKACPLCKRYLITTGKKLLKEQTVPVEKAPWLPKVDVPKTVSKEVGMNLAGEFHPVPK